jgi:hypothetical protein
MRRSLVGSKIVAEIRRPVHDAAGEVVFQPGERLDEGDRKLKGLHPDDYRLIVVEEAEPEPKPAVKTAGASKAKD